MPQGESVVCRHIPGTETGTAERGFDYRPGTEQCRGRTGSGQFQRDRHAGGVNRQRKISVSGGFPVQNRRRFLNIVKHSAGATGDNALICPHAPVRQNFGDKVKVAFAEFRPRFFLHRAKQFLCVCVEIADGVSFGGMKGQGNHRLHGGKVNFRHGIIIRHVTGAQFFVVAGAPVRFIMSLYRVVCHPNGGKARGFGGHYVNPVAEINGKRSHTGACKFQHFVFGKSVFKYGADQRQRHIVRPHAFFRLAGQIHQHYFRCRNIVGVFQQLFDQFRSALAHAHGAKRPIAGVAVGAENHPACAGKLFSGKRVNHALVGRHIDAAVSARRGKPENVVVLVDCAPHRTKGIVAVSQRIRHGERVKTARACGLNNAYVSNVVGDQRVKAQAQVLVVAFVVRGQNLCGNRVLPCGFAGEGRSVFRFSVNQIYAMSGQSDHPGLPFLYNYLYYNLSRMKCQSQ